MIRIALPLLLLLASACSDFPRDSAGTSDRLQGGELWVGVTESAHADELRDLASALAKTHRATLRLEAGAVETLLTRVEAGELDLVVGDFDKHSPWAKRVTFSKPAAGADAPIQAVAATRNGEHRWAMTVDKAIAARGGGQ